MKGDTIERERGAAGGRIHEKCKVLSVIEASGDG